MVFRRLAALLGGIALAIACGCRSPDFGRPNWHHPGRMEEQQARAAIFDPFPDDDAGPETGGRPPTYSTPPADWQRSRNFREGIWRVQP